ncbi:hypothetical protein BJ138DRAFT_1155884 [Hygrophoropsis aurantiaca]|uniref:Uncharacterized protein n=1 Tax=Hygrophoropsis aurantiaca TaxID=72124 RepID=A0ACB8A716_9AGAM|nr:hypothetical protein BJ138DRAFT_1155884 [Hygrophoropsis aurantiaca]
MSKCTLQAELQLWLAMLAAITIIATEGLLLIRTWVLGGKNRAVLIGLMVLGLGFIAAGFVMDVIEFRSTTYEAFDSPTSSCSEAYSSPTSHLWNYSGVVAFELIILFLSISHIIRYKHHRRIVLIMRNDIVYVSCILGMSVINTVITKEGYTDPAIIWQSVLHSVLASRLLFNMRQIMEQQPIIVFGSVTQPLPSHDSVELLPIMFEARAEASSITSDVEG